MNEGWQKLALVTGAFFITRRLGLEPPTFAIIQVSVLTAQPPCPNKKRLIFKEIRMHGGLEYNSAGKTVHSLKEQIGPVLKMLPQPGEVMRTNSNGVLPYCSQASECGLSGHAGPLCKRPAKVLITGGAGCFGYHLGCALISEGVCVILFDRQKPRWEIPKKAVFIQGDVRDDKAVFRACEGVDCVFHAASYGMSGSEQLEKKEEIESINVGGTKVVIDVCQKRSISRLIYTSSVSVVFGGNPIEDGDEETVPYFPLEKQTNHYSRTKAIADQMVLAANGTLLKGGGKLRTCVLRPPGIYGPEEQRHLPRVVENIQRRILCFRSGDSNTLMNWVHTSNLVQGHLLAAKALTADKEYVASGQAYYIHDGEKVNFFEWITPLYEKLGCQKPCIYLPRFLILSGAILLEHLHLFLKPVFKFTPVLTKNEVLSVIVTHTFRIDKACKELGYYPKKFTLADTVDHYLKTRLQHQL
ncbi:putative short-chain dehydrogenase/reductase family 42E member 2 [Sceloporus undulatus]|uniref:putative short-chain dehydrogenase/reductase family 42E member 2 n=1 Tax=Sceloporus undulatus TaxID=8520 RepID=UPI001C4B1F6E|nr:putative short-chain dehydrogenase/reductase family 42E member 2 [Sceloporus undulatus]